MKRKAALGLAVVLLVGCSNPHDIVFGADPTQTLADKGEQIKKMPEDERALLVQYLMASKLSSALGAPTDKPITGRTVGEVLDDARAWKLKQEEAAARQRKADAEAAALKAKVDAENAARVEQINSILSVAIIDKRVLPEDYSASRYSEMLALKFAIQNNTDRKITLVKGTVYFVDAVGDPVGDLPVEIDQAIAGKATVQTDTGRGWKINQFANNDINKIASRDFGQMKARFVPSSLAFADGEVIKLAGN